MNDDRRKRATEKAMRRRLGMNKDKAAKVKDSMLSQSDLYTTCRFCGGKVTGSLKYIQDHVERCSEHGD